MDEALVFGTKDCRFEPCQGHLLVGAHVKCTNVQAHKPNEPNHVPLMSCRARMRQALLSTSDSKGNGKVGEMSPRRPTLGQGVQGTSNNRCDSKRPTKDDQRTPALHREWPCSHAWLATRLRKIGIRLHLVVKNMAICGQRWSNSRP